MMIVMKFDLALGLSSCLAPVPYLSGLFRDATRLLVFVLGSTALCRVYGGVTRLKANTKPASNIRQKIWRKIDYRNSAPTLSPV